MSALVDSSGWIEFFTGGPNADRFGRVIESGRPLIIPSVVVYEVVRWMMRRHGKAPALTTAAAMTRFGECLPLTGHLAIEAAEISQEHGLAMADSIILAMARAHRAILWTQDADFRSINGVEYIAAEPESGKG